MEQKESKTNKHFARSIVKSLIRIAACFILYKGNIEASAIMLAGAELLGIAEEF